MWLVSFMQWIWKQWQTKKGKLIVFFVLFALFSSLYVCVVKDSVLFQSVAVEKAIVGVLIILSYTAITWFITRRQASSANALTLKATDSIYFLGFIITLCSIIAAFFSNDAANPNNLNDIVSKSGIALSSTAFALSCRTIWRLAMEPPDATETLQIKKLQQAYDELTPKISALKNAMNTLGNDYRNLSKDMKNVELNPDAFDNALHALVTVLEERANQIEKTTSISTTHYEQALRSFATQLQAILKKHGE